MKVAHFILLASSLTLIAIGVHIAMTTSIVQASPAFILVVTAARARA